MRTAMTLALGLLFATAGAGFADDKPANTVCPKSGKEVDGSKVATVEQDSGKVAIAVCCGKCKTAVEKDPDKYVAAAKENKKAE